MRAWVPWMLPVGFVVAVALISLSNAFGYVLAMVWGWLAFPYVLVYLRSHSRAHRGDRGGNGLPDVDADYWRIRLK